MSAARSATQVLAALLLAAAFAFACVAGPLSAAARAQGLPDDGEASWQLEQPKPPPPPVGVQGSTVPIGLGKVGDIEFWAPNRGLLITAGNGSTIPPGLWTYNGEGWHELANVCGATDGRIAWAGPDEFWTISDGRPGQALEAEGRTPPLQDDTLCHFSGGRVVASYASLAFQASSYQPMHAAGCIGPSDCWFAGDPLPEPQVGVFQLNWNGSSLTAAANPQGHAVQDMRLFGGSLYESVRLSPEDQVTTRESTPAVLRRINAAGVQPTFVSLLPGVPQYAPGEFPTALSFLRLSADAEALWGAADPVSPQELPEGSAPGEVTVVRYAAGGWSQIIGPGAPAANPFAGLLVSSIAAEPDSESAWVGLDTAADSEQPSPSASATVTRVSPAGTVSDEQTLPSAQETAEGVGPKGAAAKIACPAPHDCWMVTTQGWLYHLAPATERQLPANGDPAFAGPITFRPEDEGLPQVVPDAPPPDDSGLPGEAPPSISSLLASVTPTTESKVTAPLLSDLHTRVVHGSTLELSFHLAVKARIRLIAKRHNSVVASTPTRTLAAGNRKLLLHLDRRRWPTKLDLQSHALAPLPTESTRGAGHDTVSTSLVVLHRGDPFTGSGPLL
jgi:hypothetical protein